MKTATQMIPALNQTVTLRCGDLHVACTVIDVKSVYGRERVLVTPVAGAGERWVELTSLVLVGRTDVNRVMGR
jgi:hypothetical protein